MEKEFIEEKIKLLSPWYQKIELDGVMTIDSKGNNTIQMWEDIKKKLLKNLEGMRILDLGANAGYFSVLSALLGAEVISIDISDIFYQQFLFVRDFFEEKYGPLNITYYKKNISHIKFKKIGKFDYIFALSILYHIGKHEYGKYTRKALDEQIRIINILTSISNNIFVRCRNSAHNSKEYYDKIFNSFGFKSKVIRTDRVRRLLLYVSSNMEK